MKRLHKHNEHQEQPRQAEVEPLVGVDTGWAVSTGAAANLTAVVRWGMWALLLAGPLLGAWAVLSPAVPAAAPPPAKPAAGRPVSGQDAAGPGGFAEQYVTAYLEAGDSDELAAFYPAAHGVTWPSPAGGQHAQLASAVQVRHLSGGYWSVTVAARVTDDKSPAAVRYFQVPVRVQGDRSAPTLTATSLPAEVAAPITGAPAELSYGAAHAPASSDPAAVAVQGFLSTYLTDQGQVDRYLSPGTTLRAIRPAPYTAVTVSQIAEHGRQPADGAAAQVPPDGVERHLLVDAQSQEPHRAGRPMTYALELRSRGGRWEVATLEAAPTLAPSGQKGSGS